jgi:hypothetical protein
MTTSTESHQFTGTETVETDTIWSCTCGWYTIEYANAPSYHIPIEDRKAEHLAKEDAIATGRVWAEIADKNCEFQLYMQTCHDGQQYAVVRAVWMGGFREVASFPRTTGTELVERLGMMMRWNHVARLVWERNGATVDFGSLKHVWA